MSPIPYRALSRRESSSLSLRAAVVVVLLAGLAACGDKAPPAKPADKAPAAAAGDKAPAAGDKAPAKAPEPTVVTLLITGGLGGQLVPTGEGGQTKGGAAETLGRWVAEDKHCPGPVKADGQASCADASTLALATGDHWNGPALSSFFLGEPTAAVMARMGYAASALGNHELDFGREQFLKNAGIGHFTFLAANLKVKDASLAKGMDLPGFKVFDRKGLKIGVVGLTSPKTVTSAMAGRAEGLDLVGTEDALAAAIPEARKAGAEVVVVLADMCPTELQPTLEKHPEWKLALVAGGRCPAQGSTPRWVTRRSSRSAAAWRSTCAPSITKDPTQAGRRARSPSTRSWWTWRAPVRTPDAETAKIIADAKTQLEPKLGEQLGFTKKGIKQGSPEMARWVAGSMREGISADAVVINKKGIRAGSARGPHHRGQRLLGAAVRELADAGEGEGRGPGHAAVQPGGAGLGLHRRGQGQVQGRQGQAAGSRRRSTRWAPSSTSTSAVTASSSRSSIPMPKETGMAWQTPRRRVDAQPEVHRGQAAGEVAAQVAAARPTGLKRRGADPLVGPPLFHARRRPVRTRCR